MQASGFFVDAAPPRTPRWLPLGRRRLAPSSRRFTHGAFWRHGRHPDQRARLRQCGWRTCCQPATAGCRGPGPAERRDRAASLAQGSNFPRLRYAPAHRCCGARSGATYGMGLWVAVDCDSGADTEPRRRLPGLRFAPRAAAARSWRCAVRVREPHLCRPLRAGHWDAAIVLSNAGLLPRPHHRRQRGTRGAYRTVGTIYLKGEVAMAADQLAMNFLMDRDAAGWAQDLANQEADRRLRHERPPIRDQRALG